MSVDEVAATLDDPERLRPHPYDDADRFWSAAAEHQVDLLLIDAARTSGADRSWPEDARQRARTADVAAAALRTLRDRELAVVLEALAAADVPCLLLKGAALAHTLYRHPHLRRRNDADLLVRTGDAGRLADLLRPLGYARLAGTSGEYVTSQMHFDRPDCADHRYALDVHWRLVNTHTVSDAIAFDALAGASVAVPGLGPHAWTLSAPHALALACIHRVAHHQDSGHLPWLCDVRLLAAAMVPADVDVFVDAASKLAIRAACAHTIAAAAGRFRVPSAPQLIDRVRPAAGDPVEPSARFLRGGMSQTDILRSDLSSLGWRGRAVLLREHLFPPAAYMRAQYAGWPAVLLPVAYLHRVFAGAPKWLRRG